jgi:hypothetical protein
MAVRLQMKLGVVPAPDRSPDSPDTIVVVEPTVGSVGRTKGSLFLLVTSRHTGNRAREATRLAAQSIRDEYYYDESAGIRVCLEKAITTANKKLGHQRDRYGLGHDAVNGPIGAAVAVVRGNELYVATVGPAEAYLIRGARLSTLPDPHRERGLPTRELEPEVWRGEIAVGDSLVLVSPNVVARLGPDELKDALVTLHPQSAMEHLHHAFTTAGGSGSDGAIALEASEVAATHKQRALVPVRPEEPLAGAPDRSPIPLADSLTDGMAAVQAVSGRARSAAGGVAGQLLGAIQDLLPKRQTSGGRVTPYSARRETQRRAAVALLAFVVVAGGLGLALSLAGNPGGRRQVASLAVGQRALQLARDDLNQVFGPGIDLTGNDPAKAQRLLNDAFSQLTAAEAAGIPTTTTAPLRTQIVGGLNTLTHMVDVGSQVLFAFPPDAKADLGGFVIGSDGAPYILDRASKTVYRVDLKAKKATPLIRSGQIYKGVKAGDPKFIVTGGREVLVLDSKNLLWRWRPSNNTGRGTLIRLPVANSSGWGTDVREIGTFCRTPPECALYNLYVVDPSEQQILAYAPAASGDNYPASPTNWLSAARDVSTFTGLYIDGDLFATDNGVVRRFVGGKSEGWDAQAPGGDFASADSALRPSPKFSLVASGTDRRTGWLYAYDSANARIVAFDKASGQFREQYRLTGGDKAWTNLRAFMIKPGIADGPATMTWIDGNRLVTTVLEAVAPVPSPSASPGGSPGPPASPKASTKTTPRPSKSP